MTQAKGLHRSQGNEGEILSMFIPEQHHLAIVFYAMQSKAISQNAQELILRGQQEWDKYLHLLCRDFLNEIRMG